MSWNKDSKKNKKLKNVDKIMRQIITLCQSFDKI